MRCLSTVWRVPRCAMVLLGEGLPNRGRIFVGWNLYGYDTLQVMCASGSWDFVAYTGFRLGYFLNICMKNGPWTNWVTSVCFIQSCKNFSNKVSVSAKSLLIGLGVWGVCLLGFVLGWLVDLGFYIFFFLLVLFVL